jgi:soluble lytic murein transglycosylase-like protein
MRNCFRLGLATTAGVISLCAAGLPDRPQRVTSVVRTDSRSGKLVRSTVVGARTVSPQVVAPVVVAPYSPEAEAEAAPRKAPAGPVRNIDEAVERIAAQHQLPAQLIHSVIQVESNYNPNAISSAGALGLMQLIPSTARRFGVNNVFNPVENIQGGARYLRYLLDLYKGNYPLALAAYNAGEGAVARYGGVPPYRETQNYLVSVRKRLEEAKKAQASRVREEKEKKPVEVKPAGGPNPIREVVEADGSVRYVSR